FVMSGADEDAVVLDQRYRDLASMVGLPEDVLKALSDSLADAPDDMASTVAGICEWMFSWMDAHPGHLFRMIKPSTFENLFGKTYGDLASDEEKARYAVPKLKATLRQWMDGAPLKEFQQTISPNGASAEFSPDARKFVIRMIPDLAHVMGLPSRMMQIFTPGGSDPNTVEGAGPLLLAHVCVRRGLRDAEMAAFSMSGGALPRRATHRAFEGVRPHVAAAESGETLENLKERVRAGREGPQTGNRGVLEYWPGSVRQPTFVTARHRERRAGAANDRFPPLAKATQLRRVRPRAAPGGSAQKYECYLGSSRPQVVQPLPLNVVN
ncbi:hypothetical protein C5F46_14440, partial [Phaeovulum veldkampii DSM 11550]